VNEPRRFRAQIVSQQRHKRAHLLLRTPPIVGRERKQRERGYAEIGRSLRDAPYCLHAGAMSCAARQAAARRPASVAVHDDGDVHIIFSFHSTLHCKVSPQKRDQVVFNRRRPTARTCNAEPAFAACAASRTTCSSTLK